MSRTFGLLLASSLFLAVLATVPAHAGTEAAPEIKDVAGDQKLTAAAGVPLDTLGLSKNADLLNIWIDNETATNVTVHFEVDGDIGTGYGVSVGAAAYKFSFQALSNNVTVAAGFTIGPNGITGSARNLTVTGHFATFQIPRAFLGNATAGMNITNLKATSDGTIVDPATGSVTHVADTAPDTGFGANYTFTMGGANSTVPGTGGGDGNPNGAVGCTYRASETNKSDADADCLPDHWEKQYFGNITAQNGTGDPDHDGCDNRCEYLHGTDPTKADTDGDGVSDNDEIKAGTDPTDPHSHPVTTTTTSTSTSHTTTTSGTSFTNSATTDDSALGRIQADSGYAVTSAALMGAVVILSLVGLFGRWGL